MTFPLCKCGCGNRVSKRYNKYINGHNNRNKKLNEETKNKLREKMIGKVPWNKGKTKDCSESIMKQSEKMKQLRKDEESIYNSSEYKSKHLQKMNSIEVKRKIGNKAKGRQSPNLNKPLSEKQKQKISLKLKLDIKTIKFRYPFFSQIEDLRYNPDKPREKEIQVHCKNHNCQNSKEQGGWFTPTRSQLYERIRQLEKNYGNGGCYFYCSNECKNECPLYNIHNDPLKDIEKNYTNKEYQVFREFVLERDNYKCQYCGEKAEHVHHERPQKLEPFFSLDPDLAWSVCSECHYKYGHNDECSTGKLAKIICI